MPLVAIIGRANVGKSTLFNRLTRSSQALVADISGVTRDRHYGRVTWEDRTFILVDTGGLVGGDAPLGELVRRQAEVAVSEADVILLVMDGRAGPQEGDDEVVDYLRRTGKAVLLVVNKIDHPSLDNQLPDFYRFGLAPLFPVSAAHGLGLGTLLEALARHLPEMESEAAAPGIRVAILGRPNVGKSSFINFFLGEERLLVSERPGTTRDAIDTPLTYDDQDYILVDTAGLRRPSQVGREGLERQMVLKTIRALGRAEIAVLLLDAQEGLTGQDLRIVGLIEDHAKGCLILVNKWDLAPRDPQRRQDFLERIVGGLEFMAYVPVLPVSVLTGYNLKKVFPLIKEIHDQSGRRLATRELNLLIKEITERLPPPRYRGRPVKIKYLTQAEVQPPTFVAFVNQPQGVPDHYRRFLVKQLREKVGIPYAPVRLFFKGRPRK
ncbi:MAG TPA: ribosome biogenesis GTPase Der [Desulfobaccales bacterium]